MYWKFVRKVFWISAQVAHKFLQKRKEHSEIQFWNLIRKLRLWFEQPQIKKQCQSVSERDNFDKNFRLSISQNLVWFRSKSSHFGWSLQGIRRRCRRQGRVRIRHSLQIDRNSSRGSKKIAGKVVSESRPSPSQRQISKKVRLFFSYANWKK